MNLDIRHLVPEEWTIEALSRSILSITDGPFGSNLASRHYTDNGARVIRLGNLGAGKFKDDDRAYISLDRYRNLIRHAVAPGDLIVAGLGDENNSLGRACIAPENLGSAVVKADCFRVRVDAGRYDPRYLVYFLSSELGKILAQQKSRGSTRQRMNLRDVASLAIPRPPLEDQQRICDLLDVEIVRLEKVVNVVRRQIELIDLREESLLHEFTDLVNVPNVQVKRVVTRLTSGPRGWGDLVADSGVPFLRITNVPRRGISLLLDDLLFVDAPPGPERERTRTRSGDVLVSITADIGSVGLVEGEVVGGNVSQHVALLRPAQQVCLPRWLAYALRAPAANQALKTSSYGGTKIGLGLNEVAETVIPLPDLSVQSRYVNMIDSALSLAATCRNALEKKLALLSERKQALITAAVTGQIDVTTAGGMQE